eukprot:11171675-Lingulodinium_polyedra.AAC.1
MNSRRLFPRRRRLVAGAASQPTGRFNGRDRTTRAKRHPGVKPWHPALGAGRGLRVANGATRGEHPPR